MTTFRRTVMMLTMVSALTGAAGSLTTAQAGLRRMVCAAACVAGTAACCAAVPEACPGCIDLGNTCLGACGAL